MEYILTHSFSPTGWPQWVYAAGEEPDPCRSLANRRALGVRLQTAAGVGGLGGLLRALRRQDRPIDIGIVLVLASMGWSVIALVQWARAERALRIGRTIYWL